MCVCFVAMSVHAYNECVGGTEITAKNGAKFCKSDKTMDWWTAFAWCESQGRKLADFSVMCPGIPQQLADKKGACPNLQGLGDNVWLWSSLTYRSSQAFFVNFSSRAVSCYGARDDRYGFALCE